MRLLLVRTRRLAAVERSRQADDTPALRILQQLYADDGGRAA
jgi:hypothetical protein